MFRQTLQPRVSLPVDRLRPVFRATAQLVVVVHWPCDTIPPTPSRHDAGRFCSRLFSDKPDAACYRHFRGRQEDWSSLHHISDQTQTTYENQPHKNTADSFHLLSFFSELGSVGKVGPVVVALFQFVPAGFQVFAPFRESEQLPERTRRDQDAVVQIRFPELGGSQQFISEVVQIAGEFRELAQFLFLC